MTDPIIAIENLGKRYRIRRQHESERYVALRDVLASQLAAPLRWFRQSVQAAATATEDFWALKDVSFEVERGEVVGIIGRNGAGKSTLLKILSRITEPTEGRVTLGGRVASLLEVGTGFHPELTGRENIFLNGAILGMTRAEIARKYDEIVAFAEVDKFLDTPVKRYSSGMYVRLAFAVAAHLEPEILIVDEVLAVGDAEFQKKCLGKMSEVAKSGRTVVFVSHSMAAVTSLCDSGVLLHEGAVTFRGNAAAAVERYLRSTGNMETEWIPAQRRIVTVGLRIQQVRISDGAGVARARFASGDNIAIQVRCDVTSLPSSLLCVVIVRTSSGVPVFHITRQIVTHDASRTDGLELTCRILNCALYPGEYVLSVWIGRNAHQEIDHVTDVLTFVMDQGDVSGVDFDLSWRHGVCHCENEWTIEHVGDRRKREVAFVSCGT